jgi:DNA-binding CsgD family transcriptional regulator
MDQPANKPTGDEGTGEEHARDRERLERIGSAFQDGIVLVDAGGAIVWMDRMARRRVNGQLQNLSLPLSKGEREAVDCFIAPVALSVNGERLTLGVIQVEEPRQSADLIAVIEGVLADSTSWFTRTIIEKLKAVGQPKPDGNPANGTAQLDSLSAREREVLGLICEGHSDVQMANLLGLSENTVRNHVAALYRKIGVKRRTAAVIWARERGITCGADLEPTGRARRGGNGHAANGHAGNGRANNGRSGNGHDRGGAPPY